MTHTHTRIHSMTPRRAACWNWNDMMEVIAVMIYSLLLSAKGPSVSVLTTQAPVPTAAILTAGIHLYGTSTAWKSRLSWLAKTSLHRSTALMWPTLVRTNAGARVKVGFIAKDHMYKDRRTRELKWLRNNHDKKFQTYIHLYSAVLICFKITLATLKIISLIRKIALQLIVMYLINKVPTWLNRM